MNYNDDEWDGVKVLYIELLKRTHAPIDAINIEPTLYHTKNELKVEIIRGGTTVITYLMPNDMWEFFRANAI